MDFEKRLEKAIERGQQTRDEEGRLAAEKALGTEELKALHTSCRLELSEHIENCLQQMAERFPGFAFETVVGEDGWGARITRDDLTGRRGRPVEALFSRLRMLVRPYSDVHIVELVTKGTIRNKEIISRNHYQFLSQVDMDSFRELVDLWVLDYAEKFAANS